MKKDFKQVVADVKSSYDIVEYIEKSGVTLSRAGTHKWKGLCPFHTEKTPSFIVDENFQNYRCFGCGANGDIIKFSEKTEHLEFMDVLRKLAEDKNIELDFDNTDKKVDYKSLRELLKDTANFYVMNFKKLPANHPARTEVTDRGLSLSNNHYGYAPEYRKSLYNFLKDRGYSDDLMVNAGVITKFDNGSVSDFWNGRLMFIITDIRGRPIAFSGRKLYENDTRGKYVNSKDTVLFDKSNSLYNLNNAREEGSIKKELYVTEGQFDVSAFMEAGLKNVVASSGTSFTNEQALLCRRIVGENGEIIFAFDGDEAGINAALKVFKNSPIIHSQAFVIKFPDDLDPSDYRLKYGNDEFLKFLDNKIPIIQFVLEEEAKLYDLETEIGRSNFIESAANVLSLISSQSLKELYMRRVALMAFVSLDVIRATLSNNKTLPDSESIIVNKDEVFEDNYDNELINLIERDEMYDLYARLLRLSISNPGMRDKLKMIVKFFPDGLKQVAHEVVEIQPPFLPEKFTESEVMEYLIMKDDWFPLAYLMTDDDVMTHFKFLYNKVVKLRKFRRENFVRHQLSKSIGQSNNDSVDLLSYVLQKEEEEINKLKKRELEQIHSDIK